MRSARSRVDLLWLLALCLVAAGCSHAQPRGDPARAAVSLPSHDVSQVKWKTPPAAYVMERNLCIDRELTRRDLNEFGDAVGTTYARGAPQGVTTTTDRYKYVLRRRPDIAIACTRSPDEAEP